MVKELINNIDEIELLVENYRERLAPFYTSTPGSKEKVEDAHKWMLCLAAFPMAVNIQLLYQLWSNFKRLEDIHGNVHDLPVTVVSDCLLCPLIRVTGKDLYEMDTNVRAYLLDQLQINFGTEIIEDLASFLYKYALHFRSGNIWKNFYDAQEWTAILAMDPNKGAVNILQSLRTHLSNNNAYESMRVANLIGAMVKDNQEFAELIQQSIQKNEGDKISALEQHYTTKDVSAEKTIVLRKDGAMAANSVKIELPPGVVNRLSPVYEAESVRVTDGRYKPAQKGTVYAIFVGTNEYQHTDHRLTKSLEDAKKLKDALVTKQLVNEQNLTELYDSQATKENVVRKLEEYLKGATHDDTVLFYCCGNTTFTDQVHRLFFNDYMYGSDGQLTGTATHIEMKETVQRFAEQQPMVVFILDTCHAGSTEWLDKENPRHFALLASQGYEVSYETPSLTDFLVEAIESKPYVTYKYLYRYVLKRLDKQTPYFVVHPDAWDYYFLTHVKENATMHLQEMLVEIGYKVSIDGRNSPNTQRAVKDFMEKYNVDQEASVPMELKKAITLKNRSTVKTLCVFDNAANDILVKDMLAHLNTLRAEPLVQYIKEQFNTMTR